MSQSLARKTTRIRISSATLAGDRRSPAGYIGSFGLHVGIVVATMFTVAHHLEITDESPPVVPVDLVTIGQTTNVIPTVRPAPKIAPEVIPTPPSQLTVQQPVVPEQETQSAPPPPDEAPSEPVIAPPPKPAVPKERPQQAQPEKKTFNVDNVLALLNKVAPARSATPNARAGTRTIRGVGAQNAMTADLQDSLRSQVQPCWSPPVGAPRPEQLIVDFDLFLNPDGSVAQPPQLAADSAAAAAQDPYVRAAAEAARRAIYTCAPYKLPADRYAQWREINPFHFDPSQMLGQ